VETELQSQIFEQVQAAVVTFAKAGPLEWRKVGGKPAGDVELLLSLPFVQEQLASFDGDPEADANAAADAIEAAIRRAIYLLPSPYQEAAREQFGFGEREPEDTIPKQKVREAHAALRLGRTTQRWYSLPNREHAGLKPSDYVSALVACVLCGISNPTAYVNGLGPSPPKSHEPPRGASGQSRASSPELAREHSMHVPARWSTALAFGGLLACAFAVAAALGVFASGGSPRPQTVGQRSARSRSPSRQATPEPLLNRDASCASLGADVQEYTPSTELVDSSGQLGGGERGLLGRTIPNGKYSSLLEVRRGDIVKLSIKLHDTAYSSVSDVVVAVAVVPERPRCTRLMAVARSVSAPQDRAELGPLTLKSTSDSPPRLKYIPGSTALLTENGHQLAHLSDGVMGTGTAIPYQIPTGRTDFFVNFEIKIE
jgi:hypothetical protein